MAEQTPDSAATVLVADDVFENRELARMALEDEGYRVVCATDGEGALKVFEAESPDCVLLDIRMPRLDGFATCERLRALPGGDAVSVLFLTALRDVDSFDRAVAAGGDDFLTKPIRPTELVVRVKSQLDLRRMSGELRGHVEVVRRQRDDLLRMQLQKERLASFLVHDLKNPVNSIDLHAQLLSRQKDLPEAARDSVAHIRADARTLLQLILDLLDIAKGDEGRLEPRRAPVDLAVLLNDLSSTFEPRARTSGIELSLAAGPGSEGLSADAGLCRRVLENLLDNALRHTPRGGHIAVTSSGDSAAVELVVSDDGPGIPAALRDHIFDRYVQLEQPGGASRRVGRGLGLAFCRIAMEAHGGTITLEPSEKGSHFRLRFPRAA